MYKLRRFLAFLTIGLFFLGSCRSGNGGKAIFIRNDDPKIAYMGRIGVTDTAAAIFYWSGSSATLNFSGTEVSAILKDEKNTNYFYVITDDTIFSKLKPGVEKSKYELATNLKPGKHKVQLFKITECTHGKTWFYGFEVGDGAKVLSPDAKPERKIEFYGNSITSGYSVEDSVGDSKSPQYFNNYLSYAAITARYYKAAYHCISKSGIGIMVSWHSDIMPEIYDRLDPEDSNSKWSFTKFVPGIVVIDLMQNDSWLVRDIGNEQFRRRFGTKAPDEKQILNAYKNFVQRIRSKYPKAQIICTLGSMDAVKDGSKWTGYIEKAVKEMNDQNIFTFFFPYKGKQGHPKVKDQQVMANSLINFIDHNVNW